MRYRRFTLGLLLLIAAALILPNSAAQAAGPTRADCLASPNSPGCTAGLPAVEYQMLLDEMLLYPEPNVRPLAVNQEELSRFAFRKIVGGAATIYNGPNGEPIGTIDEGFNYVTVNRIQGDWIEINDGEWMPSSQLAVARPSEFTGVYLEGELKYPMAWVLVPSYPSPVPGAAGDESRPKLERYTRVNIFATAEVGGWEWYLVGPDAWIQQTMVARIVEPERPPQVKGRWFAIDLFEQVMIAYEDDTPVFATLVSSGLPQWPTREGVFTVWARQVNGHMSGAEGQADFYSLENVPYVMYFDQAISLHGTYWHDGFGYRHSHGCVNLSITDAHWAYDWSQEGGYDAPYVYVYSTGEYRD